MTSHILRVNVEMYESGGYGVIGYNYQEMGLTTMKEVHEALTKVMTKELDKIQKELNKLIKSTRKKNK